MIRNRRGGVDLPPQSLAIVVLAAVSIASGFTGAALDRVFLRSHGVPTVLPDTGFHPLSSVLRSPTEAERKQVRAHLAEQLGLNPAQAAKVDSVLDTHTAEFRVLREEIRPRVEALTRSVRQDVEKVLTEAQRDRYRALLGVQGDSTQAPPR